MNLPGPVNDLLAAVRNWAAVQPEIRALALVGSYARGTARPSSDIDLVVLADEPARFLQDPAWTGLFGIVEKEEAEQYGRVTSLRVWYAGGLEVEFGFTTPDWADEPLDPGTKRTIDDGLSVLWVRQPLLAPLVKR